MWPMKQLSVGLPLLDGRSSWSAETQRGLVAGHPFASTQESARGSVREPIPGRPWSSRL